MCINQITKNAKLILDTVDSTGSRQGSVPGSQVKKFVPYPLWQGLDGQPYELGIITHHISVPAKSCT